MGAKQWKGWAERNSLRTARRGTGAERPRCIPQGGGAAQGRQAGVQGSMVQYRHAAGGQASGRRRQWKSCGTCAKRSTTAAGVERSTVSLKLSFL